MKQITPHLWFNTQAKQAAQFYASVFANSKITRVSTIHGTPSGDCDIVSFELCSQPFMAISAGPLFTFNPSISFMVNFDPSKDKDALKNIEAAWEKLSQGGKVLMPFQEYPFSKKYGWIQDAYGLSWQLILTDPKGEERPAITPSLLFTGNKAKAQEAREFYCSVFKDSKPGALVHYGTAHKEMAQHVMFSDFRLLNTWFVAMDGGPSHQFTFNEAISLIVTCDTQEEIDHYWKKLSAVPEAEQCGWLKDKFGVSWQIVPAIMDEMMQNASQAQMARVTKAFLAMKKFDIAKLKKAYDG